MNDQLIGKWVEVTLVNKKKWIGILEEWDEEALFISNGEEFGTNNFKGSECSSGEVESVVESNEREFSVS